MHFCEHCLLAKQLEASERQKQHNAVEITVHTLTYYLVARTCTHVDDLGDYFCRGDLLAVTLYRMDREKPLHVFPRPYFKNGADKIYNTDCAGATCTSRGKAIRQHLML